jgi:non-heme chloroperoxidase
MQTTTQTDTSGANVLHRKFTKEIFMPYCNASDGTRLFYTVWGKGRPLLFIHGGNIGSEMWNFQIPQLVEEGFQCIVYDQRGFSRSDWPSSGYDFDTLAEDLNCLVSHLQLETFSAVTFSFGAGVLGRYLSNFGAARVEKAMLISAITPCFLKSADNPEGLERELYYDPFRAALMNDRPQIFRASMEGFFNPTAAEDDVTQPLADWLIGIALQNPVMAMIELFRASSETDFRKDMSSFTMPTSIVHGDCDVFAPIAATGQRTQEMIAGSVWTTYPGASHGLPFTHRRRLNRQIKEFFCA